MASMPCLRFPTIKKITRTARFSFRPQELFFASSVEMSSMAFAGKPDDGVPSKRRMLYRGQRPPRLQFEPIEEQDARNHRFARHRHSARLEDIPDPPES